MPVDVFDIADDPFADVFGCHRGPHAQGDIGARDDDPVRREGCFCWCRVCAAQFGFMNGYDCPWCEVLLVDFAGFSSREHEDADYTQYPDSALEPDMLAAKQRMLAARAAAPGRG